MGVSYDPSVNGKVAKIKLMVIDGNRNHIVAKITFENKAEFICPDWSNPEQRGLFLPHIDNNTVFFDERAI